MSLRLKVLDVLRAGPSTVPALAETLAANPSRVAEALHCALRRSEVRRRRGVAPTKVRGCRLPLTRRWLGAYGTRPQMWELAA